MNHSLKSIGIALMVLFMGIASQPVQAEEYITDPSQLPDANAYKAVVLIKAFSSLDGDNLYQYSAGSGIVISNDGIVLTNYHVVTLEDEFGEGEYQSTYQICLPSIIDKEPDCHYAAKLLAKDKDQDLALLKIEPITGLSEQLGNFKYLSLATTDSTQVNNQVIVMGYPSIGGGTITITKGIISGKDEKFNKKWIKTDAVLSFGSSGGAAIDSKGNVIGLVNSSHSDYLGSLGYLINVASINSWINSNKSLSGKDNSYLSKVKNLAKKQNELKSSNVFSNDYFSITKPADWEFTYTHEYQINLDKPSDDDGGYLSIGMFKYPNVISLDWAVAAVKDGFLQTGTISAISITKVEDITINSQPAKKIVVTYAGKTRAMYYLVNKNYLIEVSYDYGLNDKDEQAVNNIINTLKLKINNTAIESISKYVNESPKFSIKTSGDWRILHRNSKEKPIIIYNTKIPEVYIYVKIEKGDNNTKDYNDQEYLDYFKEMTNTINSSGASIDLHSVINKQELNYNLNSELSNMMFMDSSINKLSTGEVLARDVDYIIKSGNEFIFLTFRMFTNDNARFDQTLAKAQDVLKTFSLTGTPASSTNKPAVEEPKKQPIQNKPAVATGSLIQRVIGRILLQVENSGEAWYVRPDNSKRIYLKDGDAAYNLMRTLGLGISNTDLQKIPVGFEDRFVCEDADKDGLCDKLEEGLGTDPNKADTDGDGNKDGDEIKNGSNPKDNGKLTYNSALINKLRGKIVLQVESRGEAWYINPVDGKRYYMPDGPSAYQIMRYLSLGISNKDLNTITED